MPAYQWEVGFIMIEGNILPFGGTMTGGTVRAKATIMLIVLLMAGITIRRRALINIIDMASFTLHLGMGTFQFECGEIVIELGRLPAIG